MSKPTASLFKYEDDFVGIRGTASSPTFSVLNLVVGAVGTDDEIMIVNRCYPPEKLALLSRGVFKHGQSHSPVCRLQMQIVLDAARKESQLGGQSRTVFRIVL